MSKSKVDTAAIYYANNKDNNNVTDKCNNNGLIINDNNNSSQFMKLINVNDLDLLGVIYDLQTGMIPIFENTTKNGIGSNKYFEDDQINHELLKYEGLESYVLDPLLSNSNMNIFDSLIQDNMDESSQGELLSDLTSYSNNNNINVSLKNIYDDAEKDDVIVNDIDKVVSNGVFIQQRKPEINSYGKDDDDDPMFITDENTSDSGEMIVIYNEKATIKNQNDECTKAKMKKIDVKSKKIMKENPCTSGCPNECSKLNENDRRFLFDYYWSLNYQSQRDFLLKYINVHEIRRRRIKSATRKSLTRDYFLPKNGMKHKVCRRFFMSTLDVTDKLLRYTETSSNENNTVKNSS